VRFHQFPASKGNSCFDFRARDSRAPRPRWSFVLSILCLSLFLGATSPLKAQFVLQASPAGTNLAITWPASPSPTISTNPFPEFSVFQSTDLATWSALQGKAIGIPGLSGSDLNFYFGGGPGARFFRLAMDASSTNTQEVGSGGADVFGYNNLLGTLMGQNGAFSVSNFALMFPQPAYLAQIDFDPITAQYWTNFNTDPALWESNLPPSQAGKIWNDFRLTTNELSAFKTNGFVVSERLGSVSFAQSYYRVYSDDLPVFISADSILQAWHRTYDGMLEELEELELSTLMEQVITGMTARLPALAQEYQNCLAAQTSRTNSTGPLTQGIADMDFFLTTAQSLWLGEQQPSALGLPAVNQQVAAALAAVSSLNIQYFAPFGAIRTIDFSQFTIRGHYVNSVRLGRYFQTMTWCGMIDFLIAPLDARQTLLAPDPEDHLRQLGDGVVMSSLINQLTPSNGPPNPWPALDQVTRVFVGVTDSMTPPQLASLLATAGIASPCDVLNSVVLTNLETRLLTGELALSTDWQPPLFAPNGPSLVKQAASLTLFGQKFVLDGWAMTEVTWDRTAVERRKASFLDVDFSVLGNDQTVPLLVARINSTNGVVWRDGIQYQTNLAAVRGVIDSQAPSIWTNSMYTAWLGALRTLSAPTTDPKYPEAMRTRAWAMKTLTTQAASWTDLKHNTILYDQPPCTPGLSCYYPNGFVEPVPAFWAQMGAMADLAAQAVSALPLFGDITEPDREFPQFPQYDHTYSLYTVQSDEVGSLNNFSAQMAILQTMAAKELAQQPFDTNEIIFLESTMEGIYAPYFGVPMYTGWYPGLFYENVYQDSNQFNQTEGCDRWDALVADIDTDLPDDVTGDPGADIHDAVGNVNLLMIAVDNGTNRMVYAGPVLSHYEFQEPVGTRLTDGQWQTILQGPPVPLPDEWTSGYLIPGGFVYPPPTEQNQRRNTKKEAFKQSESRRQEPHFKRRS
jgi:hypothetical protein